MKTTTMKATLLFTFFIAFAIGQVSAQKKPYENPKYGKDSVTRMEVIKNISLYTEFYKQKNYKDAVNPWRYVFNNGPKASKNTYIKGANIFKNVISKSKADKQKYVDTLMMIYDQRIENYGQKGLVLGYKGADLYSYRGKDAAKEVEPILEEACKLGKEKTKSAIISVYMQAIVDQYRAKEIDGNKVIEAYTLATETLELAKKYNKKRVDDGGKYKDKSARELDNISTSLNNVEALFSESGAATCEALIGIFTPQYEQNKEDAEWLKKVTKLINRTDCTEDPLFAKASEKLYNLEPSAESAHNLARLFLKKAEYNKSGKYYEEATSLEEDAETKALYYYEWSTLAMAQGSYAKVRTLSNKALKNNPKDGRPYLMIGRAYASSKNIGKEKVEHNAVFWVAVDQFAKAKQVDPSIADQANELISTYSKYYPNFEEWFMAVGSNKGSKYTVGGWINVSTTVRF